MEDYESTKQKFELLKMARAQANEEYSNRRDEAYKKWVSECDAVWKETGVKLPYPTFQPYPTEVDIVSKAMTLYNFIKTEEKAKDEPEEAKPVEAPIEPAAQVMTAAAPSVTTQSNRAALIRNIFSANQTTPPKITG